MTKSISSFVNAMNANGGMSLTTGYVIYWSLAGPLKTVMDEKFPSWDSDDSPISMFVEEAQLPNVQAATGQMQGRYLGENQIQYPYAKFYSDVSFTWMCDANLTPLKFFHHWHSYMFDADGTETGTELDGKTVVAIRNEEKNAKLERTIRLRYPADYLSKCIVVKTEPGHAGVDDRAGIGFILQDIYPYSIDTVPLSYGTSQLTKVTVNFHYAKHHVVTNDISDYGKMGGDTFKKFLENLKKVFQ